MTYVDRTHKVSEVITHIKRQFGDESGVQVTDDDIIRWINQGQEEIFRRSEPVKSEAVTDMTSGVTNYTMPSDVLKVQSLLVNNKPLERKSYQEAEEYILYNDPDNSQTGTPLIWYEWAGTFILWPVPDATQTGAIKIRYIKAATKVSATTDILAVPDPYYNRLLEFVLSQAYELDEDWSAASTKAEQFGTNLDAQANQDSVSTNTYPRITVLEDDM